MAISAENYRLKYDYHTHTVYSHGKGTIEDNVRAAQQKGLQGIAIADHGPGHLLYGIDREKVKGARKEIEELRNKYKGMDILFSVEANIMSTGKGLDLTEPEAGDYDFVIAGYHFGIRGGFCVENFIHSSFPFKLPGRDKLKNRNTDMVIKALSENNVKILTHPGDKGPFDIFEIAKTCAALGVLLEINDRHGRPDISDIRIAAKTDVKFIINSDAHSPGKVGSCRAGIMKAFDAGLDPDRIVNIEEF